MYKKTKALSLLVSDNLIFRSAQELAVNKYLKKHNSLIFLKLAIYSHIMHQAPTLRTMSSDYASPIFKNLTQETGLHVGHLGKSTIADLLASLPTKFFQTIFEELVEKYKRILFKKTKNNIVKLDSTYIQLSKKLLKCPATSTYNSIKQKVKATVSHRDIPESINFFFKSNNSDEIAFKDAILEHRYLSNDIVVFDRGMQSRKSFAVLNKKNISFITRLSDKPQFKILEHFTNEDLRIKCDCKVKLKSKDRHWAEGVYRVVSIKSASGKNIFFVTNCWDLSATQVAEIYKSRWKIEIFFKYFKSYLNGRHFLSRCENGIKNMFYIRLIAAILTTVCSIIRGIKGFKQSKHFLQHMLQKAAIMGREKDLFNSGPPKKNLKRGPHLKESLYV